MKNCTFTGILLGVSLLLAWPNGSWAQVGCVPGQRAAISVILPSADAQVWFGNTLVPSWGTNRLFLSSSLDASKQYSYSITASWMENGERRTQTRKVFVRARQQALVDFTTPQTSAEQAPAANTPAEPPLVPPLTPEPPPTAPPEQPLLPPLAPEPGAGV